MPAFSLWVMVGSAIGGLARYWLTILAGWFWGPAFPFGTLLINTMGSFVIGVVGAATDPGEHAALRAFIMVGLCGGFTTFSSFSQQTLELLQQGRAPVALIYAGLSVGLCLASVWAGWALGGIKWG